MFITLFVIFGPYFGNLIRKSWTYATKTVRPIYTWLWDSDAKVSWARPFGTDNLGRDMLANMIKGGRTSLAVGWAAMVLALFVGTLIGVLSGYFKRLDGILMRFTDLVLSLPLLPLLLVAVTLFRQPLRAAFGPEQGMFVLIVGIIAITSWMQTARIVRGEILALKEREFILAARSIGTTPYKIITAPFTAQHHVAHHGLSDVGSCDCDHHRKRAQLSWRGLPIRLPHMGKNAC